MLYAIPCAALTAAWAATWWRCRTLKHALDRERATARLDQAVWAGEVAALETQNEEAARQATRESAVLAQAAFVVDAALAAAGSDIPRGGIDG